MEQITEGAPGIDSDIALQVSHLRDRSARRRRAAQAALRRAGAAAVAPLLAAIRSESRRARRTKPVLIGCVLASIALYGELLITPFQPSSWLIVLAMSALFAIEARLAAATTLQKEVARLLAAMDDRRAIGALAEALEYGDLLLPTDTRATAARGLAKLLPEITVADRQWITSAQWSILHRVLHGYVCNSPELILAVLSALRCVGDDQSLREVTQLAEGAAFTVDQRRIRDAALVVAETIRRRLEEERAPHCLLRPADSGGDSRLLRASFGVDEPQDELLRPTLR